MLRPFFMRAICGRFGSGESSGPPPYQIWGGGKPNSPVLTADFPYQSITTDGTTTYLTCTSTPQYGVGSTNISVKSPSNVKVYKFISNAWQFYYELNASGGSLLNITSILQANRDIYTDNTYTTVRFAKNTD